MQRRNYLKRIGALSLAALAAGCTGSETDYESSDDGDSEESGDDESASSGGGDDSAESESESGDDGDDSESESDSESGDSDEALEILEHELVREDEGTSYESVKVEGRAENVGDRQLSYVEVRARFFNEAGDQVDSSMDNMNDLDPGQTWAFEIMHLGMGEDAAEIVDYEIGVGTNW